MSTKKDEIRSFPEFAEQCEWFRCNEIGSGEKKSVFWFCGHGNNLDGACHQKLCPPLGEENELKNE